MTVEERAKKIRLLILDVDGVLTDGSIIYGDFGSEYKVFHARDGVGLILLYLSGIKSIVITARRTRAVRRRARENRVFRVYQGSFNKLKIYQKILRRLQLSDDEVCYIGDDLPDLPILKRVGLGVSVPDTCAEIKEAAHYVTRRPGGRGAVRELAEVILKAQGKWDAAVERYFS